MRPSPKDIKLFFGHLPGGGGGGDGGMVMMGSKLSNIIGVDYFTGIVLYIGQITWSNSTTMTKDSQNK